MIYFLISLINWTEQIIEIMIIARVILSWINRDPFNPLIQQLYRLTDPLLKPFQNIVPPEKLGGIDISPLIALLAVQLVARVLIRFLLSF